MRRAVLVGIGGLALGGCTGLEQSVGEASMFHRDYAGPAAGAPRALMRLSADGVIRVTPGSACADFTRPDTGVALFSIFSLKDYSYLHDRRLGVAGTAPAGLVSTEIALQADQPVVLSYTGHWTERGTAYHCQVHQSFVPETDAHYQLIARPDYAEKRCNVVVTRLTEPQSVVVTAPATLCGV